MKTAKEWADALIAARPAMVAGQDPVDFADAFAGIIETIQRDAIESAAKAAAEAFADHGSPECAVRDLLDDSVNSSNHKKT